MMKNEIEKNINQILVSLDFDDYSSLFIEPLVMLASQLEADLCGLFFEDSQLQKIANLPFSREITFPSALIRNLNSDHIAQHIKQNTELLRNTMKELSLLSNVTCSFRTVKGPRIESVLNESNNFELIVLLPEKYSSLKIRRSEILDELINPAILFYDGSRQAQKSTHIIRSLVDSGVLHQLNILTLNHDFEVELNEQIPFDKIDINYRHVDSYEISNIISLLKSQKTGLLVLPLEDKLINQSEEIKKILDVLGCPLLLVR